MGAGKLRELASRGVAAGLAIGVTALAAACSSTSTSPPSLAAEQTAAPATPTVTPTSVPVLGTLTIGTFPSTPDGLKALTVCEQWAGLRGAYVSRVRADTPYQLEQWFSGSQWTVAFKSANQFKTDPDYSRISASFGVATVGDTADIADARLLDQACAAAD